MDVWEYRTFRGSMVCQEYGYQSGPVRLALELDWFDQTQERVQPCANRERQTVDERTHHCLEKNTCTANQFKYVMYQRLTQFAASEDQVSSKNEQQGPCQRL